MGDSLAVSRPKRAAGQDGTLRRLRSGCNFPNCPNDANRKTPCRPDGVLAQCEIDAILAAVGCHDHTNKWKNIDEFEKFLTNRNHVPEKHYGIFEKDVAVCRFFDDKKGGNILADIMAKNTETGMGNARIPNTDIKLVNYSYCPECGEIYTQKELRDYYMNPVIRPGKNLRETFRKETRVICKYCQTPFLPTLIIVDSGPKNTVQYLCRMQVIDAIEVYMDGEYHENVLTKNRKNYRIRQEDNLVGCLNDLEIHKLEKKPALISNFLQYTPPPLMLSFIEGENIAKGDVVFGNWQKRTTPEIELAYTRIH